MTAFTSDAFALFAGMLFGRHKLAPALSPKKTVEGAVGGLVGAVVCTMLYGVLIHIAFGVQANYLSLAVYGAVGSVFSQLGDLSFSQHQAAVSNQGLRQYLSRTRRRSGPL